MRSPSTALLLAAVALMGCDGLTQHTFTGPAGAAFDLITLTPTEEAILAEANITVLHPGEGEDAATGGVVGSGLLAFTALRDRDGNVRGEWEYHQGTVVRMHGDVTCLDVQGNQASFGGPITRLNAPENFVSPFTGAPPTDAVFHVVDTGEGAGNGDRFSPPLATVILSGTIPETPCGLVNITQPAVRGNLQVRDAS